MRYFLVETFSTFRYVRKMRIRCLATCALLMAGAFHCSTTQSLGSQLDDTQISAQVRALLLQDISLNGFGISVATDEDEVFLMGRVSSRDDRLQAEEYARSVAGVWSVINHLKVGVSTEASTYPDLKLRQAVEKRILRDQSVLGLNVRVFVHEGEVYLLGRVSSESERQQAISVARETEGVIGVQNYLKAGRTRKATLEQP